MKYQFNENVIEFHRSNKFSQIWIPEIVRDLSICCGLVRLPVKFLIEKKLKSYIIWSFGLILTEFIIEGLQS